MIDRLTILEGDAVDRLQTLETGSVQCCVTSPPYDALRTYGGFTWDFEATAKELYRVMYDGGIVCWNVNDSVVNGSETLTSCHQKIFFHGLGFRIHDTMIYEKVNFTNPSRNRYHQMFEYVFVLSKGAPRCFNPIVDKPNVCAGKNGTLGRNTTRQVDGEMMLKTHDRIKNSDFGMRGNVWRGKSSGQENMCQPIEHPATMPEWLAHDLILSWSNVGDIVLDPFAGSGTTGKVALELGRKAILIELNPSYCDLIRQRTDVTPGLQLA